MILEVLSSMALSVSTPDPCLSMPSRDAELACNLLLSEQERERGEALLQQAIDAARPREQTFGMPVVEELRDNQRLWEDYSDAACAASSHNAGGASGALHDSFEAYNTYFRCLRESQAQRSVFLWREHNLGGSEPAPITEVEWPEGMGAQGPFGDRIPTRASNPSR